MPQTKERHTEYMRTYRLKQKVRQAKDSADLRAFRAQQKKAKQ